MVNNCLPSEATVLPPASASHALCSLSSSSASLAHSSSGLGMFAASRLRRFRGLFYCLADFFAACLRVRYAVLQFLHHIMVLRVGGVAGSVLCSNAVVPLLLSYANRGAGASAGLEGGGAGDDEQMHGRI